MKDTSNISCYHCRHVDFTFFMQQGTQRNQSKKFKTDKRTFLCNIKSNVCTSLPQEHFQGKQLTKIHQRTGCDVLCKHITCTLLCFWLVWMQLSHCVPDIHSLHNVAFIITLNIRGCNCKNNSFTIGLTN